jgi:gliding motility-associated-like protein
MKLRNLYFLLPLLLVGNLLHAQSTNCVLDSFYIKSLETQDFGNQLNAILQLPNRDNKRFEILVSEDGGFVYTTKTITTTGFNLLLGLPKKQLYFKVRYTNGTCVSETLPVATIIPNASNSKYGQIDVVWNATGNQTIYELKRFGGIYYSKNDLTDTSYTDKQIECRGNYFYQIIGVYNDANRNQTAVISNYAQSNANYFQNPPNNKALVATILGDGSPQLNILDATGDMLYNLFRSIDDGPFQKIADTHDIQFTDIGNANQNRFCYYVNYLDACQNVSGNSTQACTIFLKANGNVLDWNPPVDTSAPIYYDVVHLPQESLGIQSSNNYVITSTSQGQEQYQITATFNFTIDGKSISVETTSNPVTIDFSAKVYLPNTFTPNADGQNDVFEAKFDPNNIKDFRMQIYARWGELVFETDEFITSWDGTYKGKKASNGSYIVKLYFKDTFGNEHIKSKEIKLMK